MNQYFSCDFLCNYTRKNPSEKIIKEFGLSRYKFYSIKNDLKKISQIDFSKRVKIDFKYLEKFEKII